MRRCFLLFFWYGAAAMTAAQPVPQPLAERSQQSANGWYISPHGTLRVLLLFAEIEYDVHPDKDPQPGGDGQWPKGELPAWKDDLFDPRPLPKPQARISQYYHEMSLGDYTLLGDYFPVMLTLKESDYPNMGNYNGAAIAEANKHGPFRTAHGLTVEDLDLWKDGGKPGMPKEAGADDPHSFDHVMLILRNSRLTFGHGSVDPGSSGLLFGYPSDTQSRFGGMTGLPLQILKHEFNHLLLGGNNFHSGGGNAMEFTSYQMCLQGGWSMMGAANSALLSASAWDRQRLGWKPPGSPWTVRAWRPGGRACNGDLDPMQGDTGLFVIGDFIPTGDALRIRIPNIPEQQFQQWIWLENHRGHLVNGSNSDRYMWEGVGNGCVTPFGPGIYAQVQIDKEQREGKSIYAGYADYLRPLPANGYYDLISDQSKMDHTCPFDQALTIFQRNSGMENPLSGFHEMELPVYDRDGDGIIRRSESYVPYVRYVNGSYDAQVVFNGRPEHAFTLRGNAKIGMGTNPGTANVLTRVQGDKPAAKQDSSNNRVTYLNQISIELVAEAPDGAITVRVRAHDPLIDRDVRWASDSIVLPAARDTALPALVLAERRLLRLDRGSTPRRSDRPEIVDGQTWFNGATHLTVARQAHVVLRRKAELRLEHGSVLHLLPGSTLELGPKARLRIGRGCRVVLHPGAGLRQAAKARVKCSGGGVLERMAE